MIAEELLRRISDAFGLAARTDWPTAVDEALASMSRQLQLPEGRLTQQIAGDGNLVRELAGHLTVGESHFLRHAEQFDLLLDEFASRLAGDDSRLDVWSAGCSRGEEPLTLAFLAQSRFGEPALERLHIVGSDICSAALEKARRGIYHPWSLRSAPPWFVDSNFVTTSEGYYAAKGPARRGIRFEHMAVQERLMTMAPASVDVILFRNVAIYLSPEATTSIYEGFHRVLKDGGLLLTAPADPAPPRTLFAHDAVGPAGAFWRYCGRAAQIPKRATLPSSKTRTLPDVHRQPAWRSRPAQGQRAATSAENRTPARATDRQRKPETALLCQADEQAVASGTNRAVHRDQLMQSGRSHLEAHRLTEAIDAFRRVLFMNQRDCIGRFWYAATLQRAGQLSKARGQVAELSRQLCQLDGDTRLEDGDTTAATLLNAVRLMEASL